MRQLLTCQRGGTTTAYGLYHRMLLVLYMSYSTSIVGLPSYNQPGREESRIPEEYHLYRSIEEPTEART